MSSRTLISALFFRKLENEMVQVLSKWWYCWQMVLALSLPLFLFTSRMWSRSVIEHTMRCRVCTRANIFHHHHHHRTLYPMKGYSLTSDNLSPYLCALWGCLLTTLCDTRQISFGPALALNKHGLGYLPFVKGVEMDICSSSIITNSTASNVVGFPCGVVVFKQDHWLPLIIYLLELAMNVDAVICPFNADDF